MAFYLPSLASYPPPTMVSPHASVFTDFGDTVTYDSSYPRLFLIENQILQAEAFV